MVQFWLVELLVLLSVVRVDSMGHVSRNEETLVDASVVVLLFVRGVYTLKNPLSDLCSHVTIGSLSRLGANFFVIK